MVIAIVSLSVVLAAVSVLAIWQYRRINNLYIFAASLANSVNHWQSIADAAHWAIAKDNARQVNFEMGVVLPPEEENNN